MLKIAKNRGERIAYAIKAVKIRKLAALAMELGVDESAISRWKKNGNLTLDNAGALCELLDVSLDWIVLGRGHCFQHRHNSTTEIEYDLLLALRHFGNGSTKHLCEFLKCTLANR